MIYVQKDYETSHIPTAIWIANAEEMGDSENIKKLKAKLNAHISNGGKNEIIAYCYTGHTAGLVCGVLGTLGFNIKNLMYGYSLAWDGSQKPHIPYLEAPKEDQYGNKVLYKNIPSP
ncbi:hypothetical protein IT084_17500 [Desulfallas sp. Bu1-1]|uniref:rhodanese-like domain-containing protein n=1 Tax=Desulfallas sp. Bu1-1 TaxID=2787620 RepID=UPI00189D4D47|nr:rhodanese-like domain-containing protein [Desulfallas sp. Bu1-1]MBF7084735.1 hypothetical protein [Desulfallas sp. Bu1-1]